MIAAALRGEFTTSTRGFGGGRVGNLVMGLVFGLLLAAHSAGSGPLVGAHALIDIVAFVGSALLAGRVSFLPGP